MESGSSNAAAAAASEARSSHLVELSADIVSAYVSHNALSASDLGKLIASVHTALVTLSGGSEPEEVVELKPAVPIKKSITPEYLICLEDGKKFKSLKRHLRTEYDMSPEEYRVKWGLPPDYPMVAPTYSEARSRLAKTIGLGRKPKTPTGRGRAKTSA